VTPTLRAYPTLLRVGFAEAIAYRAEMLVWMLTNTMPLVNLALWHAVARSGPIGGFGQQDLVAYFLGALLVRQVTGSWVLWEMSRDIRTGALSMRLLRPVHPLIAYSAENLSALPLRAGLVVPIVAVAIALAPGARLGHDPVEWALLPAALVGAWLITFLTMTMMGTLGFFIEQSASVFEVWLALYFSLSGYLFPLEFFAARAPWVVRAARALPFYAMNGFPIELMLGLRTRAEALRSLALEWAYVAAFLVATAALWRAGMKRYNAYGA
jgi:ABC-2 type transport system permease protein